MKARWQLAWVWVGLVGGQALGGQEDWTHLGRDASRQSIAVDGPARLLLDPNQGCWKSDPGMQFESASGAVLYRGTVYAYARHTDPNGQDKSQVVAFDAQSGHPAWKGTGGIVDLAVDGSWSTPCVDIRHNTVLVGSGTKVFAFDANDGSSAWSSPTELDGPVVNASICTALDLPHARAFITDCDAFGSSGRLYCINLDANEPNNPYEPGHKMWDYELGPTLGNSPTYVGGRVYVASGGTIYAFDANAVSPPNKPSWSVPDANWTAANPKNSIGGQFWGGVTMTQEGFLYAATYDTTEDPNTNKSTLVKLDRKDGRIVWTKAIERTDTIPVVVGDMIFVSGGLLGYGSQPKIQAFRDLGDRVDSLWPAVVGVGGWTSQPVYAKGRLYVGGDEIPWGETGAGSYRRLYVLDATTGIELDHVEGCGNSPIVTCDSVYSVGPDALMKFHQPRALADINGDGTVDGADRKCLVDAMGKGYPLGTVRADLDLDGDVDEADLEILEAEMTGAQP